MIDQIAELCKEKFKGELDDALTLANISSWLFFLISWHVFYHLDKTTLIWGMASVKMKAVFDFSGGVISSFSSLEILLSLFFVYAVSWLARELSEGLFYLFSLREDFGAHMVECNIILLRLKNSSPLAMYFLGKEADVKLAESRKFFSRKRTVSQVFLGFGLSAALGGELNWLNFIVLFLSFSSFVFITWSGFHYYVEKILPYYLGKEFSKGNFAKFEEGAE